MTTSRTSSGGRCIIRNDFPVWTRAGTNICIKENIRPRRLTTGVNATIHDAVGYSTKDIQENTQHI